MPEQLDHYPITAARVNETHHFEVADLEGADIQPLRDGRYQLLLDGKSMILQLLELNREQKRFVFLLNGTRYTVQLSDRLDTMIDRLGLAEGASTAAANIQAPMPGLVRAVLVKEGQSISTGDKVLILEAMKMENVLKAPGDGVVKRIAVTEGAAVDKNQLLIELES